MSLNSGFRIDLTPDQVVELAKQLPGKEKRELAKAFEREGLLTRLEELMKKVRTNELSEETITAEVEAVRTKRYAARKKKAAKGHR
ncbi:MAG: hypothetical protein WAR83_06855 [Flavobacteriales bacterium]